MRMAKIIATAYGDLTGDGVRETVYLTGTRRTGSAAWQDIQLEILDGASGRITRRSLAQDAGYEPRLFLGPLTDRGRSDVMVSVDSGGSGGIASYTIFAYMDGAYRRVFDTEAYNAASDYTVTYQDQYVVRALSRDMAYLIDISDRDAAYLSEIYDENGVLRQPREGWVDPVSLLVPADIDGDGVLELMAWQRISGLYHADALGDFISTLAWDGRRFALSGQTVGIVGTSREARE